jgi:hypothetical protein
MSENFYFAYGSNLDTSQMEERIGEPISLGRAYAEGFKLVFNVWSPRWYGWAANLKKLTSDYSSRKHHIFDIINVNYLFTFVYIPYTC